MKNSVTPDLTVPNAIAVAAENLDLVADPEKHFAVIMKDGIIYKNTAK